MVKSKKTLIILVLIFFAFFGLLANFSLVRAAATTDTQQTPSISIIFDLFGLLFPKGDSSPQSSNLNENQGGQSSSSPATTVTSLRDIFTEVEQKVQVPARIVEGVLLVESPATFNFSKAEIQNYSQPGATIPSCRPNECSAAGPMQMTTGIDNIGSSRCGGCGLNQCPNAWAQYGQGLQPCNLRDSIYAGAAKLKKDSGNKGGVWTQDQVYRAAVRYYGSCSDNYRYQKLGGRTYCEFLWWYYNGK